MGMESGQVRCQWYVHNIVYYTISFTADVVVEFLQI